MNFIHSKKPFNKENSRPNWSQLWILAIIHERNNTNSTKSLLQKLEKEETLPNSFMRQAFVTLITNVKRKENCIHVEGQEIVFTSYIKEKWGKVKKCFPPLHPYPSKSWKGLAGDCGGSSGAQWLLLLGVLCSQRGWGGGVVICPQRCSHFLA